MALGASTPYRPYQVGTQIETIEQWKQLSLEERNRLLEDAWAFKHFLFRRQLTSRMLVNNQDTGQTEKEMLLHIVFPDEFETVTTSGKERIASAAGFVNFITQPTDDVDRRLQQIRNGITGDQRDFEHFWEPDIIVVWQHGDADTRISKAWQQLSDDDASNPSNEPEARDRIDASIARRRGQPEFRSKLLDAYRTCCVITGCDAVEALEAAHIRRYKEADLNDISNGLLLRADIHTLFDRHLLGVDPDTNKVWIGEHLRGTQYAGLEGTEVSHPRRRKDRPDADALREHREEAQKLGRFN